MGLGLVALLLVSANLYQSVRRNVLPHLSGLMQSERVACKAPALHRHGVLRHVSPVPAPPREHPARPEARPAVPPAPEPPSLHVETWHPVPDWQEIETKLQRLETELRMEEVRLRLAERHLQSLHVILP
ncbi:MAG: hypothetical protein KatS3mg043_0026 [Rhodothermaceae bacterium]|nr:MAG: hypothetical protein KatS3mg043_0026 [Rhodothermaceae bacterium]